MAPACLGLTLPRGAGGEAGRRDPGRNVHALCPLGLLEGTGAGDKRLTFTAPPSSPPRSCWGGGARSSAPREQKLAFATGPWGRSGWTTASTISMPGAAGPSWAGGHRRPIEDGEVKCVVITARRTAPPTSTYAISPYSLRRVLPDDAFYFDYFRDLWNFQMAPSLSFMVWFDRKLTDVDLTFFSYDCIFNTYADMSNVLPHVYKGGSMLEMVISPADHVEGLPDEVIADIAIGQIKALFPEARESKVLKWKVVRARQGVYRALPGMESHRTRSSARPNGKLLPHRRLNTKTHVSSGGMEAAIWTANKGSRSSSPRTGWASRSRSTLSTSPRKG